MRTWKQLSDAEKAVISSHASQGMNSTDIGKLVGRDRRTVARYLLNKKHPVTRPRRSKYKKLTEPTVRLIIRRAALRKESARTIQRSLKLDVGVRRVQQVLSETPYLRYRKRTHTVAMAGKHKEKRIDFAHKHRPYGETYWQNIIFTDEKKFNLDGPDGLQCYWHDLRNEPEMFSQRVSGGGSVMIWGAISSKGTVGLARVDGRMNSEQYCSILQGNLFGAADRLFSDKWILQQDNSSVHASNFTKSWLESFEVETLEWPAKSPDLNVIENVWGQMARAVYAGGKQYDDVSDLEAAVHEAWDALELSYLQSLYKSMPRRLFSVVERKGRIINY